VLEDPIVLETGHREEPDLCFDRLFSSSSVHTVWVVVDGVAWATNGHILIRRDGPRPDVGAVRQPWRTDMRAEDFATVVVVPAQNVTLVRVERVHDRGTAVDRYHGDPDGRDVYLDASYASVLAGRVVQGADPLGPVFAVADDGTAAAVMMPRTAPEPSPR
jgi:hypothetical protein